MAKPKGEIFQKDIKIFSGTDQSRVAGGAIAPAKTGQLPDRGPNFSEVRLLIQDHGKETIGDANTRDPEWVDFTEISGIYRLKDIPDVINIGAETATRPFVFKSSSITLKLDNSDYIFDNLKKVNLTTIDGNAAKFLSTAEGSNLDLNYRNARVVARVPQSEMTVEYDLGNFIVKNIETDTNGNARLNLDSNEKLFIEAQASKVKDGRNWYFDRSVKFLVEELVKSVRREYDQTLDGDGSVTKATEIIPVNDKIAVSGVETPEGSDPPKAFSEYGRPIAEIKYTDNDHAGEKRFIVTAQAVRNIFRTKLENNISIGANIIRIRIDDAITIRKGDILTIGKANHGSDLNEEKVTVLEDMVFTGTAEEKKNIKVTGLQKSHTSGELVERWIVYVGVSRKIEEKINTRDEYYILAFDPDRDESVNLITEANSINFNYPIRFLGLKQTLKDPTDPASLSYGFGIPTVTKLISIGNTHTFPGKPNEDGEFTAWTINTLIDWNDIDSHLTLAASRLESLTADGGVYTGEMCFRSLSPVVDRNYVHVDSDDEVIPSRRYGAQGLGQFSQETIFPSNFSEVRGIFANKRYLGYGYFAGLVQDVEGSSSSQIDEIEIYAPTYNNKIMAFQGHPNVGGTLYIIGTNKSTDYDTEEMFYHSLITTSARISYSYQSYSIPPDNPNDTIIDHNKITYKLDAGIDETFVKESSVVLIIPDTGKMYLNNCGENLLVQDPNNVTFPGYDQTTNTSSAIESTEFHNKIRLEKKDNIDSNKTLVATEKNLVDNSILDKGYYNVLVQKKKFEVQKGDIISESTTVGTTSKGKRIRVVPAQYIAQPFNIQNYNFGIPCFDSTYSAVREGTGDAYPDTFRDMHCWIFPVIGMWVRYDQMNNALVSFDGTTISANGNSELLGYWYLDYAEAVDDRSTHLLVDNYPLLDLAISDERGLVITPQRVDDYNNLFAKEHMPLCSILHNVNDVDGTVGNHYGYLSGTLKTRITDLLGGAWITDYTEFRGNVNSDDESINYERWDPQGTEFPTLYHSTIGNKNIVWKFKKIKDTQAKGHLFVSPFCQPVRPYHFHYPVGTHTAKFITGISNEQHKSNLDITANITRITKYYSSGGRGIITTGTALAGDLSQIYLAHAASSVTDIYNNLTISITEGTGAGQERIISSYTYGAPNYYKIATVTIDWDIAPANDSVYEIYGIWAGCKITTGDHSPEYLSSNLVGLAARITVTPLVSPRGDQGSYKIVERATEYPPFWIKVENFRPSWLPGETEEFSNIADTITIYQIEEYEGYAVNSNFNYGSEEVYNFLNRAEDDINKHMIWVADRFSQGKALGLIHGKGNNLSAGGILEGLTITDSSDIPREITIPLGYHYGKTNLVKINLFAQLSEFFILAIRDTFNAPEAVVRIQYTAKPLFNLQTGDKVILNITGGTGSDNKGRWDVLRAYQVDGASYIEVSKKVDQTWQGLGNTPSDKIYKQTAIEPGNIYEASWGDPQGVTSTVHIISVIDNNTLIAEWIVTENEDQNTLPSGIGRISKIYPTNGDSGPPEDYRDFDSIVGLIDNEETATLDEAVSTDGSQAPMYFPEYIRHRDVLPEFPETLVDGDTSTYLNSFLSIFKINFLSQPTNYGNINYPKALYSKALHKFWYYEQRVTRTYGESIEGSVEFDSGIKPTAYGSNFFDSSAKWYLSRRDEDYSYTIGVYQYYANAECYSPNFNTASLDTDNNLYALIHTNYRNTRLDNRFVFTKFSLNFQKNFKLDPYNDDVVYFSRRKFKINSETRLYIDSRISEYNYNSGSPTIEDIAAFPNSVFASSNIFDENTAGQSLSNPIYEEVNASMSNSVDENENIDELETFLLGDFEIHGIFKSYTGPTFDAQVVNWKNRGFVELIEEITTAPYAKPYYENPNDSSEGFSKPQLGYSSNGVLWSFESWTDGAQYTDSSKFIIRSSDYATFDAHLFLIKGWSEDNQICQDLFTGVDVGGLAAIILRRNELLSDVEDERKEREFVGYFALQSIHDPTYDQDLFYFARSEHYSEFPLYSMRRFSFRLTDEDGYYFADSFDNTIKKWDGRTIFSIGPDSVLTVLGSGQPCVEGDFGQYELMTKIDTAYEEIFGFSSGPRIHLASSTIKGGRNIIWKYSKSLAFHIAVADFENLSVWEALSQLAELTNSLLSFDRSGVLHFETRPPISEETPFLFTFDKLEEGNVISISKKPSFSHIYNYIEIIPSKPILPDPKIDLTSYSDIASINANHDLFIKDKSLDITQRSKSKNRPIIRAYQKDFERKKILMICNNGQFDPLLEKRGLYSRWKYMIVNDVVQLRLTVEGQSTDTFIKVNKIPYDDVSGQLSVKKGGYVYIGNEGPFRISVDDDYVNVANGTINLVDDDDNPLTLGSVFEVGLPVTVFDFKETVTGDPLKLVGGIDKVAFFADGGGDKDGELTYSPKTFFTEIGEWTFDEREIRNPLRLTRPLASTDGYMHVDNVANLHIEGYVSIDGEIIQYERDFGNRLNVISGLENDHAIASTVYIMPTPPRLGATANADYAPGNWRIGGYDEIGPSCLDEYHLYDPNEDESPYYDFDPSTGGEPISALEFYWKGQTAISYTDPVNSILMENYTVASSTNYRTRQRTFVEMAIDFQNFRFIDGDKIDIDFPGIKLEAQEHLKKTYSNYESIQRNGLRQYPATTNRFFNSKTAIISARRILDGINFGSQLTVVANINDIKDLDFRKIVRVVDHDLFNGKPGNTVIGYISSLKFNHSRQQATINLLTQNL